MIHTIHANHVNTPTGDFNRRHRNSDPALMRTRLTDTKQYMWSDDSAYGFGGSKGIHSVMPQPSLVTRNTQLPEKLARIKELVVSGRYQIHKEKLAERMLNTMAGLLLAS